MFDHQCFEASELDARKPGTRMKPDGFKPKLGRAGFALHMHMRWFLTICGIEEEPVRSAAQNRGHSMKLRREDSASQGRPCCGLTTCASAAGHHLSARTNLRSTALKEPAARAASRARPVGCMRGLDTSLRDVRCSRRLRKQAEQDRKEAKPMLKITGFEASTDQQLPVPHLHPV